MMRYSYPSHDYSRLERLQRAATAVLLKVSLVVGLLWLGGVLVQHAGSSRHTVCTPTDAKVVMCQHTHRDFLGLRRMEYPEFQLKSAEISTYQASRSDCDRTEYYTAYQLDIVGGLPDATRQSVTMKSYDDNEGQAYQDLTKVLNLLNGHSRQAIALGDMNIGGIFWLLAYVGFMGNGLKREGFLWQFLRA